MCKYAPCCALLTCVLLVVLFYVWTYLDIAVFVGCIGARCVSVSKARVLGIAF